MIDELFFLGKPVRFKTGVYVYPPTVGQMAETEFFSHYERVLTYSQEEIEDEFLEIKRILEVYPTPFEFLLNNCYHNKQYEDLCKKAFEFFLHEQVTFAYEQKLILIGDVAETLKTATSIKDFVVIMEDEFFELQNLIRRSVGTEPVDKPPENESAIVAEMRRKARRRDRLKAKQAEKKESGISFFTTLVSICCTGLGITPLNVGEMSYVALKSLLRKYQQKEKYDLDIKSLLAGADSKKVKPEYWIANFKD